MAETPKRIFVTRSPGLTRQCHNGEELEAVFADHGFAIVRPEEHNTAEQATLFAGAAVVAGYGGSAQFNAIFRSQPATRIVVSSESYYASNEWLISSVKGDDYYHSWCPADIPRAETFSNASFHSNFAFDFARHGDALKSLLAGLPEADEPSRTARRRSCA